MEDIEERDVALKLRNRFPHIVLVKTDVPIATSRGMIGATDFSRIDIETDD